MEHMTPDQLAAAAAQEERARGMPAGTLSHILQLETNMGRYNHPSRTGALGVAQIEPSTAQQYGFTPQQIQDDAQAIHAAGAIMAHNLHVYPDVRTATAAYNAGIGGAHKFSLTHNIADLPMETRGYLSKLDGLTHPDNAAPTIVRQNGAPQSSFSPTLAPATPWSNALASSSTGVYNPIQQSGNTAGMMQGGLDNGRRDSTAGSSFVSAFSPPGTAQPASPAGIAGAEPRNIGGYERTPSFADSAGGYGGGQSYNSTPTIEPPHFLKPSFPHAEYAGPDAGDRYYAAVSPGQQSSAG